MFYHYKSRKLFCYKISFMVVAWMFICILRLFFVFFYSWWLMYRYWSSKWKENRHNWTHGCFPILHCSGCHPPVRFSKANWHFFFFVFFAVDEGMKEYPAAHTCGVQLHEEWWSWRVCKIDVWGHPGYPRVYQELVYQQPWRKGKDRNTFSSIDEKGRKVLSPMKL